MNSYFDFVYAKALYECLGDVVKQECYGCEVDHPSQVQHSCIMYDTHEHIEMYFHKLMSTVSEDQIRLAWSDIVDSLNICPELVALQKLKIYDKNYLDTMKTELWRTKIEKMVMSIFHLESRLFRSDI
jgi:hypothetical protein